MAAGKLSQKKVLELLNVLSKYFDIWNPEPIMHTYPLSVADITSTCRLPAKEVNPMGKMLKGLSEKTLNLKGTKFQGLKIHLSSIESYYDNHVVHYYIPRILDPTYIGYIPENAIKSQEQIYAENLINKLSPDEQLLVNLFRNENIKDLITELRKKYFYLGPDSFAKYKPLAKAICVIRDLQDIDNGTLVFKDGG